MDINILFQSQIKLNSHVVMYCCILKLYLIYYALLQLQTNLQPKLRPFFTGHGTEDHPRPPSRMSGTQCVHHWTDAQWRCWPDHTLSIVTLVPYTSVTGTFLST